ncbi:MAG: class I SAM-dependent methyltransferase [Candidatus Bathyarchaeia archaeon]
MFDWNKHWEKTRENEEARIFALKMAGMLCNFMRDKNIRLVADYGCGPATLLFTLARRFPQTEFYGFDIAKSIISKNTKKALHSNLQNLHFEQGSLPFPCAKRAYDLIVCFATLHYVEKIECAIKNLFKLINPEGYLIFNYPNIFTRLAYQKTIKPQDEQMKNRFALVLAGKNLLTLKKIKNILGVKPKRFYSSNRANVYVVVHKSMFLHLPKFQRMLLHKTQICVVLTDILQHLGDEQG